MTTDQRKRKLDYMKANAVSWLTKKISQEHEYKRNKKDRRNSERK